MTVTGFWRVCFWTAAAFVFHVAQVSTAWGTIRFELPFFLAIRNAALPVPMPGLTFFLPSLLFDVMDGHFTATLTHLVVFLLARRLKSVIDFGRLPTCWVLGCLLVLLDRWLFGMLMELRVPAPGGWFWRMVLDPSYLLTVICLPLGWLGARSKN